MLTGFYFGFGEFGRKLAIDISNLYKSEKELDPYKIIGFLMCYDFYPGVHFLQELEKLGLKEVAGDGKIYLEASRIPVPEYKQLSVRIESLDAGVGSFWPIASEAVKENFSKSEGALGGNNQYTDTLDLKNIEDRRMGMKPSFFIFAGSSAGGTGNGAAPEFAKNYLRWLESKGIKAPHILSIGVTVLPFENDPRLHIAEPNALMHLARASEAVKTLFIADNEYFYRKGYPTETAERMVNRLLAYSIVSLFLMNFATTRRWEAADYNNFFAVTRRASITVPSFKSISVEDISKIIRVLDESFLIDFIFNTIISGLAAEIDFKKKPPEKALTIIAFPREIDVKDEVISEIERNLTKIFKEETEIKDYNCTIIRDAPIREVWVTTYFVEPYLYRIKEIVKRGREFLEKEDKIRNHIKRMIETVPGSKIREKVTRDMQEYADMIRESYLKFRDDFKMYFTDDSNPGRHFFLLYVTKPRLPESKRRTRNLKINVAYLPKDIIETDEKFVVHLHTKPPQINETFVVEEYSDRKLQETIGTFTKILQDYRKLKGSASLHDPRITLRIRGVEVPVPQDALMCVVEELPEDSVLNLYFEETDKNSSGR